MKIIFLAKGSVQLGSSRYRAYQISDQFKIHGYNSQVIDLSSFQAWSPATFYQLSRILAQLSRSDTLILQKALFPPDLIPLVFLFRHLNRFKLIFDFDDAGYLYWPWTYKLLSSRSDLVIPGSESLLRYTSAFNSNMVKIPTCVNLVHYHNPRKKYSRQALNLVWVGTLSSHMPNLKILVNPFKKLIPQISFTFTLISSQSELTEYNPSSLFKHIGPSYREIAINNWQNPKHLQDIFTHIDIGLMPLTNTEFNRGRCAFKLVEYMASKVVAVASNVGENKYLIKHKHNGLLCNTSTDWVDSLIFLSQHRQTLRKYAQNAYQTIKHNYSLDKAFALYQQAITKLHET